MTDFFGPLFTQIARDQLEVGEDFKPIAFATGIHVLNDGNADYETDSRSSAMEIAEDACDFVWLPKGVWYITMSNSDTEKHGFVVLTPEQQEQVRADMDAQSKQAEK